MIVLEYCEVLSDISIDNFAFKVTWHPIIPSHCLLWFRDSVISDNFTVLGSFSHFDKRKVLEFITRYSTSEKLRDSIADKQFQHKISQMTMADLASIDRLSAAQKKAAFRSLYNLDNAIEKADLAARRRFMAKKFHPDRGGDTSAMRIINEAYEFLISETS